jgi:glutamate/tyrosine decarboxylase-like PLP-dependent enzyme
MSVKAYGMRAFRDSVETALELAEQLEEILNASSNWEVMTSASLSVITFRHKPKETNLNDEQLDQLNQHISDCIIDAGEAMLATTVVNDRTVLRMCLINPRTKMDDIRSTLRLLETYALEYLRADHNSEQDVLPNAQ